MTKQFIVRMLCGQPAEFTFMYIFAETKEEAKKAVEDPMCFSIQVNEVDEE